MSINHTVQTTLRKYFDDPKNFTPGLALVIAATSDSVMRGYAYRNAVDDHREHQALRAAAAAASLSHLAASVAAEWEDEPGDVSTHEFKYSWLVSIAAGKNSVLVARAIKAEMSDLGDIVRALDRIVEKLNENLDAAHRDDPRFANARMR